MHLIQLVFLDYFNQIIIDTLPLCVWSYHVFERKLLHTVRTPIAVN